MQIPGMVVFLLWVGLFIGNLFYAMFAGWAKGFPKAIERSFFQGWAFFMLFIFSLIF